MTDPTDAEIDDALARGRAARSQEPRAAKAHYDAVLGKVVVELTNDCTFAFPPWLAQGLEGAAAEQLAQVKVLSSGYGLHWEALDADLSVPSLLAGLFGTRAHMARLAGQATSPAKAAAARANGAKGGRPLGDTIKMIKEDLVVGKLEVEAGGVRVTSHVVETPVQEQVTLHEERVTLERRPVNERVSGTEAFRDQTIEARTTAEEAVVAKDVRVVEEIGIKKEATDRVETVRDTVRETKVDVEDTSATVHRTGGSTKTWTTGATSGMNAPRK